MTTLDDDDVDYYYKMLKTDASEPLDFARYLYGFCKAHGAKINTEESEEDGNQL